MDVVDSTQHHPGGDDPNGGPHRVTTSVNRQWSDMNPLTLLKTVGTATLAISIATHPLYLVIARQQCMDGSVTSSSIFKGVYQQGGTRGLFKGVGIVASGAVVADLVYYLTVEYSKQYLPFESKLARNFWAGVVADGISGPMYVPFAIISQRLMTAGVTNDSSCPSLSARGTMQSIIRQGGIAGLFKGLSLSLAMMPISGVWWTVYEGLKVAAYTAFEKYVEVPTGAAPELLSSTTDNVVVNGFVGGATGGVLAAVLNPIRVVQTRVQVLDELPTPPADTQGGGGVNTNTTSRFRQGRIASITRNIYTRNGVRGFFKGLPVNVAIGAVSGVGFGVFYEGSKQLADQSGQ